MDDDYDDDDGSIPLRRKGRAGALLLVSSVLKCEARAEAERALDATD